MLAATVAGQLETPRYMGEPFGWKTEHSGHHVSSKFAPKWTFGSLPANPAVHLKRMVSGSMDALSK